MRIGRLALSAALPPLLSLAMSSCSPADPVPADSMTFGIYPDGYAGGGSTNPAPENAAKTARALDTLQGAHHEFLLREHTGYPFDHFGLVRDDASPKPAFWTYRDLVQAQP